MRVCREWIVEFVNYLTRIRGIHAEREALEKLKVKNYRKKK